MMFILLLLSLLLVCGLALAFFRQRRRFKPITGGIDRRISLEHTQPVELYSNSFSHCSRKVRLVLAELNIEAKYHAIDLIETGWYQTVSPEYLQVNPAGLVPTLVHEGHPVFESDDILNYAQTLAAPDAPKLVPDDVDLQAEMNEWLHFCAIVSANLFGGMKDRAGACIPGLTMPMFITSIQYVPLRKILAGFFFHHTVKSPAMFTAFKLFGLGPMLKLKPVREFIHASRDHMGAHLEMINQTLEAHGQPWILGKTYSLADVSIGCMLLRLEEVGWLRWFTQHSSIDEVLRYYHRLTERPSWRQAIIAHDHPIIAQSRKDLADVVETNPSLAELVYGPAARIDATDKEVHLW